MHRKIHRALIMPLLLVIAFYPVLVISFAASVGAQTEDVIAVSKTTYEIEEFSSVAVDYTLQVDPADVQISFSSSDPNVVSVDDLGLMSGRTVGTATITIMVIHEEDTITILLDVTVYALEGQIVFDNTVFYLIRGLYYDVTYTLTSPNLNADSLVWTSSNPEIARVEGGRVYGLKAGSAQITATSGSVSSTMSVHVTVPLTDIEFNITYLEITIGEQFSLPNLIFVPYDTTAPRQATYSVDDESILEFVSSDELVAKKVGKTLIRAKIYDSEAILEVDVRAQKTDSGADILNLIVENVENDQMSLIIEDISLYLGERFSLTLPSDYIIEFMANEEDGKIIIVLDDILIQNSMNKLDEIVVPKEILQLLENKRISFHIVDQRGVPLIIYHFNKSFNHDVNLRFSLELIEENSPFYQSLSGRAYSMRFYNANGFGEETTIELSAILLNSSYSQLHFIYEIVDNQLVFTDQEVIVNMKDMLEFNVLNNHYAITFNKLTQTGFNDAVLLLGGILGVIVATGLFIYRDRLFFKKKTDEEELA